MPGGGLEPVRDRDPGQQGGDRAGDRREQADHDPVGQHHQSEVSGRRPHGGQQAELAQPAMRHDREAGGRDEADEQHDHGCQDQGEGCRGGLLGGTPPLPEELGARGEPAETVARPLVPGADQDADGGRRGDRRRGHQRELVGEVGRVLHQPDDGPGTVEVDRVPDGDAKGPGHGVRERDLPGGGRVATLAKGQHRGAQRALRVLTPEVHRLDRPRHRDRRVADHVDGAVDGRDRGQVGLDGGGIGATELEPALGVAELAVARGVRL